MPRLEICNCDLHWQWINWTLLFDTMEVSMVRLASLAIAQHVFQPALESALTGRPESGPELISRKIVSCEREQRLYRGEQISRKKCFPRIQRVTAISRKISRSWAPKMGSNMRPRYIQFRDIHDRDISSLHCIWYIWKIIFQIKFYFAISLLPQFSGKKI